MLPKRFRIGKVEISILFMRSTKPNPINPKKLTLDFNSLYEISVSMLMS